MAKLGQTVDVPIQFFVTITTSEAADHDAAARGVREQVEAQVRDVFRPALERLAALEAERERLRAVVLAVAEHTVPCSEDANDVGESLAVSLEAALGLPPQSEWTTIEAALRALAGAS